MNSYIDIKQYKYVWDKDSSRQARIQFMFDSETNTFKFYQAQYQGVNNTYNEDDWQFLHDLSKEILELIKKECD